MELGKTLGCIPLRASQAVRPFPGLLLSLSWPVFQQQWQGCFVQSLLYTICFGMIEFHKLRLLGGFSFYFNFGLPAWRMFYCCSSFCVFTGKPPKTAHVGSLVPILRITRELMFVAIYKHFHAHFSISTHLFQQHFKGSFRFV